MPVDAPFTLQQSFAVTFHYPVHFCRGVFDPDNPLLADTLAAPGAGRRTRLLLVVDDGLAAADPTLVGRIDAYLRAHAGRLEPGAAPLVVPGGEGAKNQPRVLRQVVEALAAARIDRHGYLVAVGGGALLDMAGLAAAVVHRGVRLVRLPSTVLAQNDAAVGVKNGINAFGAKNFLGSFAPPHAVIADTDLLATLPRRDYIAGLAEAVKAALIRDAALFVWLEREAAALRRRAADATDHMIRRTAEIHLRHITGGGDPFELGSARPLDFGHWAAHRLEVLSGHALRHGEAVAIGIALDTLYSARSGRLAAAQAERILALLRRLELPTSHPLLRQAAGREALLHGLEEFREHLGGELTITLLEAIGRGVEVHDIDRAAMRAAMAELAGDDEAPCA